MGENKQLRETRFLFIWLFIFILLNMLIEPFMQDNLPVRMLNDVALIIVLGIAVFILKKRFIGTILFILTVLSTASTYLLLSKTALVITCITSSCFLCMVIYQIVAYIYSQEKITADAVIGGFCAYMLIGVLCGILYMNIETINPGSFDFGPHATISEFGRNSSLLNYYSFSALLTIGMGDIIPISPTARALTIIEGLLGQFYIVFFISSLVGMFISQRKVRKEWPDDEE
ncbi:MAG TPA: potassium channel family protein [Desulfomonilia bacterium]